MLIIPKTNHPEKYDDCRNISCTSFLSKLAEGFMLKMIQEEIAVDDDQFGGIKGTGTDHFLVETMMDVMECLEDPGSAVTLASIDLSKAFNRIDPRTCLKAMAERGASTQSLRLAGSFLMGRSMRVKIHGNVFSSVRTMPGGTPQGTRSGNFFFCIATYDIQRMTADPTTYHHLQRHDSNVTTTSVQRSDAFSELGLTDLMERLIPQSSPLPDQSWTCDCEGNGNGLKIPRPVNNPSICQEKNKEAAALVGHPPQCWIGNSSMT